ncbi:class II peroxidase [Aaosphaeria arxii CBS 175.79]|uniref:Peroxidase n=1 Tax=Aaosphaeria arxii CBS 175.79 TaxID=1450172 RepID=A0A6A5XVT5_9PLEO|nr:class II peroxidase [Aaosphaeria arxii CBS 175.79]KAF2016364.1 class II peroxidase [Aaosphaeria arxii CBS 175.79]
MYISTALVSLLVASSTTQALQLSDVSASASNAISELKRAPIISNLISLFSRQKGGSCPAVWSEISETLTAQFLADGQCTDAARAAIRGAFHDCFNGACDGSLILAGECSRTENRGLERLCDNLGNLASEKDVGVADLIQFAGAHAIKTCPGGPTIPVKVGRKDSSEPNPEGVLPSANASASDLMRLFGSKGFSPIDLAALVGAHTAGRQRTVDPTQAGATFDSTPGQWDNKFYTETLKKEAPFTIPADRNLADHPVTGLTFKAFSLSQAAWAIAFVPAMTKMSMIGVSGSLTDCTSALPGGSSKRDVRAAPLFDRT